MNLKKHISIFLTVLFLVSNFGMAFYLHYCGGEISSITINPTTSVVSTLSKDDCCQKREALKKEKCCKDKKIEIKKNGLDKIFKSISFNLDGPFLISEYNPLVFISVSNSKNKTSLSYYCDANAPPLYQLYNQYLLYDNYNV